MGGTDVFDLFVGFLSVGGGVDVMIAQTLFSEEVAVTLRTMVTRELVL